MYGYKQRFVLTNHTQMGNWVNITYNLDPNLGNGGSPQDVNVQETWLNQRALKALGSGSTTRNSGLILSHFRSVFQESRLTPTKLPHCGRFPLVLYRKKLAIRASLLESRQRLVILVWAGDSVKLSEKHM